MITSCPHCSSPIEIDRETLVSLQGHTHFTCLSCQGLVEVPSPAGPRPVAPQRATPNAANRHPAVGAKLTRSTVATHAKTHRGINRNILILGSVTLLVLGGLGFFLASHSVGKSIDAIFSSQLGSTLWVRQDDQTRVLDGHDIMSVESLDNPRKAAFRWRAVSGSAIAGNGAWMDLFNGSDISHWRGKNQKSFPEAAWKIEDGSGNYPKPLSTVGHRPYCLRILGTRQRSPERERLRCPTDGSQRLLLFDFCLAAFRQQGDARFAMMQFSPQVWEC